MDVVQFHYLKFGYIRYHVQPNHETRYIFYVSELLFIKRQVGRPTQVSDGYLPAVKQKHNKEQPG